jgi:hypothetical protein
MFHTGQKSVGCKSGATILFRGTGCPVRFGESSRCCFVERIRDRVLDRACLRPELTLADIGSGDGLVAFGAIARMGPSQRVILTDVSGIQELSTSFRMGQPDEE